jgi:hypothetical protein
MVNAAAVSRYMSELSYKTKDNYELANLLSRLSDDLETFGTPFAKRWNEFSSLEKRVILQCKQAIENEQQPANNT